MASTAFEYRIGPGDVLRVNVFEHPQLSSGPWKSGVPGSPVSSAGSIPCEKKNTSAGSRP